MKANLVYAAGLGIAAISTQASVGLRVSEITTVTPVAAQGQFAALVGSDEAVNPKAILESSPNAVLDSSGCVNTLADTSGLFGWYSEPVAIPHATFASNEFMGREVVSAGNTIVASSDTRLAIFENSEQNQPTFEALTPPEISLETRRIAVSPDGLEIAVNDSLFGILTFYRRGVSGWSGVAAAQVLTLNDPNRTGESLTYSADGTYFFVGSTGVGIDKGVRIFERDMGGNWQISSKTLPGKFTGVSQLAWSANRLLVADRNSILVYKPVMDGFAFSHAIGLSSPARFIKPFENGFSISVEGQLQIFRFSNSFFNPGFVRDYGSFGSSGVSEVSPSVFVAASRHSTNLFTPCGHIDFFSAIDGVQHGRYVLPKGDSIFATTVASGPWGVVVGGVTLSGAGEVYLISRDRIFGGQNPPVGTNGEGQGSFE